MDREKVPDRREFLQDVCGGAAFLAGGAMVGSAAARAEGGTEPGEAPAPAAPGSPLPTIQLGKHTVTRLIAGGNPMGGYSHSTPDMTKTMLEFFTPERSIEFLVDCWKAGINTWQVFPVSAHACATVKSGSCFRASISSAISACSKMSSCR